MNTPNLTQNLTSHSVANLHIETDDIILYLQEPDLDKHRHLREHILGCNSCLKQTHDLSQLTQLVKDNKKSLPIENINLLNKHLNNRFYSNSQSTYPSTLKNITDLFNKRLSRIRRLISDKPKIVLSSCCLLIILSIFASSALHTPDPIKIASYQDSAFMEFKRDSTPGIGFFTSNHINRLLYNGLNLSIHDNKLSANWDKVINADDYQLTIYADSDFDKQVIVQLKTFSNQIQIDNLKLEPAINYHYILSGNTTTGLSFNISGGFIF